MPQLYKNYQINKIYFFRLPVMPQNYLFLMALLPFFNTAPFEGYTLASPCSAGLKMR